MKKFINLKKFVWVAALAFILIITTIWAIQNPVKDSGRLQRGSYNSVEIVHDTSGDLVRLTLNIETTDKTFSLWVNNFLADEGQYVYLENTGYSFSGQMCTFIVDDFKIDEFSLMLPSLNDGKNIDFLKFSDALTFFSHTYLKDDELAQKSDEVREYLKK